MLRTWCTSLKGDLKPNLSMQPLSTRAAAPPLATFSVVFSSKLPSRDITVPYLLVSVGGEARGWSVEGWYQEDAGAGRRCCIWPSVAFCRALACGKSWADQGQQATLTSVPQLPACISITPLRRQQERSSKQICAPVSSTYGASPSRWPAAGTSSPPCLREMDLSSSMAISEYLGLPIT